MKFFFSFLLLLTCGAAFAQPGEEKAKDTSWKVMFRESYPKTNVIVHTKLDVNFDYDKSYIYGKEWLTLTPHFYPTDSVRLDAKGMDIKQVSIMNGTSKTPLKYTYDTQQLNIKLDKMYAGGQQYTLYFEYTGKPDELEGATGSAAITDAKGLYFINPKGLEKNKPTQIWTQGETEANSVWMITIDKPDQKSTQEIAMTVPAKYVTLSNGLLTTKKTNKDGTRTDTWKMDLPHAPYLFFMGVGDFAVIKDTYKGKEVSYYVEPNQAKYARGVFGNTPEMMKFFSERLGVEYPWAKYSQMVGRDYVSGAMENTTATLHQESAYQNSRQLADGNSWEETIAHELFHQWFGDYVTAESWSNLTVNESFANYSEYLWDEYKYGKDMADDHNFDDMSGYLNSGSDKKDLVRYFYSDKEDMFDAVSYNKGGRILHMLRNYVGDDAFFKGLQNYLVTNKFKTGEAAQLRLAIEEVSGKDLAWFFNQWYYGSGHPVLKIDYNYETPGKAMVRVEQTQKSGKVFTLPVAVDVYTGANKTRMTVWLRNKVDSFYIPYNVKPDLINFDADKILLAQKTDNKTEENFIAQWKYAKNYLDRREAIDFFAKNKSPELAKGLNDKYWGLREYTINKLSSSPYKADAVVLSQIETMANTANDKNLKAAAINYLVKNGDAKYLAIYKAGVNDSSYKVAGASLKGYAALDADGAFVVAKRLASDAKGALSTAVNDLLLSKGTDADFETLSSGFREGGLTQAKFNMINKYADYLAKLNNMQNIKKGIDDIIYFRNLVPASYRDNTDPAIKSALGKITKAKGAEIEAYVNEKMK